MVVVFFIADLYFESVMDGKPGVSRPIRDSNEHAGIRIFLPYLVDHPDNTVAEFLTRVPQQAHVPLGSHQAVFHEKRSGPDVLPAGQIAAVVKLLPVLARLGIAWPC